MKKEFLVGICLSFAFLFFFVGCTPIEFYPNEGEWYCEELQIQLSFDAGGDCFYIYENEQIKCGCGSDKGSTWLSVCSQDADSEYFFLGEEVFGAEFVSLEQDVLVVYSETDGRNYTFHRVE